METSENGIALIEGFEGFSEKPYRDSAGYMTVGYGHKIQNGEACDSITEDEAADLLAQDLTTAENVVNQHVTCALNQNQFDALVSFVFNVGAGREGVKDGFVTLASGRPSHMLLCLNAGDYDGAAAQFEKWDHVSGVENDGILDRRLKEKAIFINGYG